MLLTLAHNLVDLAIFLAADELFVLVGQLNLDPHLVGAALDEGNLVDDHHCRLYSIVGSVDGEGQILKADIGSRVRTDIREHGSDISWGWGAHASLRIRHYDPP